MFKNKFRAKMKKPQIFRRIKSMMECTCTGWLLEARGWTVRHDVLCPLSLIYQSHTMTNEKQQPNPGSKEAEELGCTCPIIDNHFGKGLPTGDFWISEDCPLHALPRLSRR
jgi:hypothetical protein